MILASTITILDTKKGIYITDGYRLTQKNKKLMDKEVEKLNINNPWQFRLSYPITIKKWQIINFNPLSY